MRSPTLVTRMLDVPSLPRIDAARLYPTRADCRARYERVFDAWAWCPSDGLEWRLPAGSAGLDTSDRIERSNPAELAFIFHKHACCTFLPRELACLHARGYGLTDEWALAPYAIDDATDQLHAHRVRPRDVFWLAATSLRALVWGLHDWAHFHNHGPFDEPAMTEFECDMLAIEWLRTNQQNVGISDSDLTHVALDLAALSRARFAEEGRPLPEVELETLFCSPYPVPRS